MKAIRFHASIPRYVLTKGLGKISKSAYYKFLSPTKLDEIPEPKIRPEWVKIKTIYAGICGSDINTILLKESPLLEPLCSFPSVLGHEVIGIVDEVGEGVITLKQGDRVVVDPILSCKVRGIQPLCINCENGNTVRCDNFDSGNLSRGFDLGWCRDTGGGFSQFFLAHHSQVYKIPEVVSNENGVLIEPFTIGLHAVIRHFPKDSDTVIIVGTGVIGIMVMTALRVLGSKAKIIAIDKTDQREVAIEKCKADNFIQVTKGYYKELAKELNIKLYKPLLHRLYGPIIRKKDLTVGGGADIVFECVGLPSTIEDALRFTKGGGKMVLIGNPEELTIDWSLVWFKELQIYGSFGSCMETDKSGTKKHAFETALELISSGKVDLSWIVTHKFHFPDEYKKAFKYSMNKGKFNVIKAIFTFLE
jgi:threonine dehydrogenase-like Zn-dependent dehydrogenase